VCSVAELRAGVVLERLRWKILKKFSVLNVPLNFLRTSPRDFRRKNKKKNRVDIKKGCRRFRCWSRRESAWPRSQVILAMGGTPGPAPRSMQLSRPSLLSYLQRFNKKRRVHYKIDVQPRLRSDAPSPRLRTATKAQRTTAEASSRAC